MAVHAKGILSRMGWGGRWLTLAALAACPILSGCLTLPWAETPKETAPVGKVSQIITTWENHVVDQADIQHSGRLTPCVAGRLYLFAPDGKLPLICEGDVRVQLRYNDVTEPDGQPKLLEEWPIPSDVLQQMRSKDMVGWGYNLVLPWATFHPTLRNLTMVVSFTPTGGYPIYSHTKLRIQEEAQFSVHKGVQ
jgi:hypothetical protein